MSDILAIRILWALRAKHWGIRRVSIVSSPGMVRVTVTVPTWTWVYLLPIYLRLHLWWLMRACAFDLRADCIYLRPEVLTGPIEKPAP